MEATTQPQGSYVVVGGLTVPFEVAFAMMDLLLHPEWRSALAAATARAAGPCAEGEKPLTDKS